MSNDDVTEQVIRDAKELTKLWEHFIDYESDSTSGDIHAPPGLVVLIEHLVEMALEGDSYFDRLKLEAPTVHSRVAAALQATGTTLFKFGQFCYSRGIIHQNLTPCRCSSARVEEFISEVLGDDVA